MCTSLTRMYGNARPTAKLAVQLTMVAMVTATGLASWRKSSATISQGIAPVCVCVCEKQGSVVCSRTNQKLRTYMNLKLGELFALLLMSYSRKGKPL